MARRAHQLPSPAPELRQVRQGLLQRRALAVVTPGAEGSGGAETGGERGSGGRAEDGMPRNGVGVAAVITAPVCASLFGARKPVPLLLRLCFLTVLCDARCDPKRSLLWGWRQNHVEN